MKKTIGIFALTLLSACMYRESFEMYQPITASEKAMLDNPPAPLLRVVDDLLPTLVQSTYEDEAVALKHGRPLTEFELGLAQKVGVAHPEKVRLMITDNLPISAEDPASAIHTAGLTQRYGIFIKPIILADIEQYYEVLAHELVHVRQFEREGVEGLNRRLLLEGLVLNGKLIPIEREAVKIGESVYNDPDTVYGF